MLCETMKFRKALYAGSFDPFTNGYLYIAEYGAELFDELIIGIASNSNKMRSTNIYKMQQAIQNELACYNNVSVVIIDGLVADYCKDNGIRYLLRGLRNTSDYLYEENIAKINKEINPGLKTIYLRADNDAISSSMVRELNAHGKDVARFVPEEIYKLYTK